MNHNRSIIYRPQIDGLRTIAVLPVIFYHFNMFQEYTSGGFGGVDVFFVISGFLVNSIIISDILKNKFRFAVFYQRRVRRLFPAMFALFVILLIISYFVYYEKSMYQELVKEVKNALLKFYFRSNVSIDGYWGDQAKTWPLLHFWSLAVEQQFYMITPILLNLLAKITKNKLFLISAIILYCIIIGISFLLSIIYTEKIPMFAFYLIICRAWQLGLGAILAVVLHQKSIDKIKQKLKKVLGRDTIFQKQIFNRIALQIISWGGLVMILLSYYNFNDERDAFPGYKALFPCIGTVLFIGANFIRFQYRKQQEIKCEYSKDSQRQELKNTVIQGSFKKLQIMQIQNQNQNFDISKQKYISQKQIILSSAYILSFRPIVWIGNISYSLYLWHWPIWLLNIQCQSESSDISLLNKLFLCILTFMIAYFSTYYIQNPIRNKKNVSTRLLWKAFAFCWIGLMSYTLTAQFFQIGRSVQFLEIQKLLIQNKTQTGPYLYPVRDVQGTLIVNPYKDYDLNLIKLQTIRKIPEYKGFYAFNAKKNNQFKSYFVNMKQYDNSDYDAFNQACIMNIGNSHTRQHSFTMVQLAHQYNVSLMITIEPGQPLKLNQSKYNIWKNKQIQLYRPKIIFIQQYSLYYDDKQNSLKDIIKNIIDPLINISVPPKLIVLFGDNPSINLKVGAQKNQFPTVMEKKYIEKDTQSWDFINYIKFQDLDKQIIKQNKIFQIIHQQYDTNVVKFYPHLHQFMQNPITGQLQLCGSEVDGEYLYFDSNHLSIHGAKRYKSYLEQKIFSKVNELCLQTQK